MPELKAGWRFPPNSRKAHFFDEGQIICLCRKWMFAGLTQGDANSPPSRDDCVECRKRLEKRIAKEAK
jgi:hypothetical protein